MSVILNESEAKALLEKVIKYSKADECVVSLSGSQNGNVRYANNEVSTSGSVSTQNIAVMSAFGKRVGIATIDEFNESAYEKVVQRSEELARLAPENPEYMPILGPQEYLKPNAYFESTANITAADRAEATGKSLALTDKDNLSAAGFLENRAGFSAMLNSKGLFAYYPETVVNFSLTVRTSDGTGSGYAIRGYNDFKKMDTVEPTRIAVQKSLGSMEARALEPGKYTVILEPTAAVVLMESMFRGMDARSADEGRSFFSKPGGGNRIGEKIVDERVNIYSDPLNSELPSSTWSQDGLPVGKMNWVEKGVLKNLPYSRFWAQQKGVNPVPMPTNMIVEGGTKSLEQLISETERGILVTKLWYIRPVDPQTILLTGLTRDGTFYIENGRIRFPVKNFRFNESPIIMLNNLEEFGKAERAVGTESYRSYIMPPMKIREFTFSSLSDAV